MVSSGAFVSSGRWVRLGSGLKLDFQSKGAEETKVLLEHIKPLVGRAALILITLEGLWIILK